MSMSKPTCLYWWTRNRLAFSLYRDQSIQLCVKMILRWVSLKSQTGFGPNTVLFAFLIGKLSNIISTHSITGPWNHKGLAVLASSPIIFAWEESPDRLSSLIMLTPHQRMHLQSTGVFVLSLRGAFLYSEESFWGPASVLCLYIFTFSVKPQRWIFLWKRFRCEFFSLFEVEVFKDFFK